MKKIRVVLTDDSAMVRSMLRSFLESAPDMEVVGEAENGQQAIDLVRSLSPDLITMDLEMPVMGGMQAIAQIMATKAVPILVVSSVADAQNAYEAVNRGALDVLSKPTYSEEAAAEFVAKVRMLAGVPVISHIIVKQHAAPLARPAATGGLAPGVHASAALPGALEMAANRRVFAIASSTGGPQALAKILAALPANFPCPVVVAQHISDGFAQGMAEWLGKLCRLKLKLAEDGEALQAGVVYISPSEKNAIITPLRRFSLLDRPGHDIFHPNCSVLLNSVADVFGAQSVGIILTGMSDDGVSGMLKILHSGGQTLAQDEESSLIFGMNKQAIDAGAVRCVLPLDKIAEKMIRLAQGGLEQAAGAHER